MVVPGMGAQPDLHSQWFAKNMVGASTPQDMSAAFLGIQNTMDTSPMPDNVRPDLWEKLLCPALV